jgi:hypothetical protein
MESWMEVTEPSIEWCGLRSLVVSSAVACFLVGCHPARPSRLPIDRASHIVVAVVSNGVVSEREADLLAELVVREIKATGKFGSVARQSGPPGAGEVLLRCEVREVRVIPVSDDTRTLQRLIVPFPSLHPEELKRYGVSVHVSVIDGASGEVLGDTLVQGISREGAVFEGNGGDGAESQAMEAVAQALVGVVGEQ